MFNIQLYLERFKNFGQDQKQLKQNIVLSIKEVTGLDIDMNNLIIKNGEVIIKSSPAIKNTLFIKKVAILAKIKEKQKTPVLNLR